MVITLVGPNQYAKRRELRKLVDSNPQQRIAGGDGLAIWYEQLGQSDLFGQSSILVAERIIEDLAKSEQQLLVEYLLAQGALTSEQQIIFLIKDDKILDKSPLGSLLSQSKVVRFPKPSAAALQLWVQQEAGRLGVAIAKPLIPVLLAKLGSDQFALETELERWSLHQPAEITADDLANIPALESDADTFGLTTAWERRNTATALGALVMLRRQGVADQMIIGMLGWKIENLLLKSAENQRSGKWTYPQISAAMQSLFKLDLAVKQGKLDPEVGLELWLVESMGS